MAKPGNGRRKTNGADDYKVQVIDRRSKYQQDTEQILSKGLSKAELDKALTKLRHEFIQDLQKLADSATNKAIDRFFSKYDKRNKGSNSGSDDKGNVINSLLQTTKSGNEASSKASSNMTSTLTNILDQFKGTNTNSAALNSGLMQNLQNLGGKVGGFASKMSSGMGNIGKILGGAGGASGGGMMGGAGGVLAILWKLYQVAGEIASGINNLFVDGINKAIDQQNSMMGKINARLYGLTEQFSVSTDKNYNYYSELTDDITGKFLRSSYVSQTELWTNIQKVVSSGIGFNLEERAYIQTIADYLVEGFDVTETNLVNAIRLNQYDLTQSQLGTRALINEFLNANYQDTSYMNSLYTSVYANIQGALSQMNYGDATEFNYNLQKWLGSLYSVGASDSLINQLASGINMLATGDVSGLEGNSSLQNLLVMGATKAGLSYSQMLTEGIDSSDINKLLGSVVSYLQDIADNTDNEVVKNAYKNIIGVGVADLRAIQNLTDAEITSLAATTQTFQDTINAATNQVSIFEGSNGSSNRIGVAKRIENQMANLLYSVGQQLVNSPSDYAEYRKSQMIQSIIDSLAPSLGVVGDIVQAISGPANAMVANNAIMNAFNKAMSAAGYGEYDPEDLANEIATNIGETLTVDENGNVSVVSYEDLAEAIAALQENDQYTPLYGMDTGTFASFYQGDESAALNAINYANTHGFAMIPADELPSGTQTILSSFVNDHTFWDERDGQYYSNYDSIQQDGTNWVWMKTDGNKLTYEDYSGLIDGSIVGATEVARTLDQYNAADADQAANNIANSSPVYGWETLIAMLLQSGWDPIDNGMGIDPFGKGYYTTRGANIYGLNANGTIDTTNVVGTTTTGAGVFGLTNLQQASTTEATPTVVSGGISTSSQLITNAAETINSLSENQAAVQAQVQTITSVQADNTKTVDHLYTALFIDGLAVNVSLNQLSDAVSAKLVEVMKSGNSNITEKLNSTLSVEVSNTNTLYQTLAASKEW